MNKSTALEAIAKRAGAFIEVLRNSRMVSESYSTKELLSRCRRHVCRRARNVDEGFETLEMVMLSLPVGLMHSFSGVAPMASWDYEGGYRELCEALKIMFASTSHQYSWQYDTEHCLLLIALNSQQLVLHNLDIREDVQWELFERIANFLSAELSEHGQVFYDVATGDQTSMQVVVRRSSLDQISEYLISGRDLRARYLYEGLP